MKKGITLSFLTLFVVFFAKAQVTLTSSNLPIVVVTTTNNVAILDSPKVVAQMKIIYNGPGKTNNVNDTKYDFNGRIGIELRGNSSQSFNQKQYGLETQVANGDNLNVSLLGMPAENDWVLNAPYNDVSMVRNVLAYKIWNDMNHYGPRTRLVEMILNNQYNGVYILTEKIKRDSLRVDIAKLGKTDNTGRELTGGYIVKIDAVNNVNDKSFTSTIKGFKRAANSTVQTQNTDVVFIYDYPKSKDITPQQQAYIRKYIDTVETYLRDGNMSYRDYISRPSFIDYFIHTEMSKNADGMKRSAFFYKEKEKADGSKGKLKAGTVWDYNLAYGNCNFCRANKVDGWVYQGCETLPVPALWTNLLKDPLYVNDLKCRYTELRKTILHKDTINKNIDTYMNTLNEASSRQLTKYKEVLKPTGNTGGGFFNPNDPTGWYAGYRVTSYAAERDSLKKFINNRLTWMDANMPGTCVPVGFDSEVKQIAFSIYPNPTTSNISLKVPEGAEKIEIFTMTGEKIEELTPEVLLKEFDVHGLENQASGTYFVRVTIGGVVHTSKVIKQ